MRVTDYKLRVVVNVKADHRDVSFRSVRVEVDHYDVSFRKLMCEH